MSIVEPKIIDSHIHQPISEGIIDVAPQGGASGPAPVPVTSGLWQHLDASQGVTTGAVFEWQDISGNSRHVSQGTGSLQPTQSTTPDLGLTSVLFSSDDFLFDATIDNAAIVDLQTVIAVVYREASVGRYMCVANGAANTGYYPDMWGGYAGASSTSLANTHFGSFSHAASSTASVAVTDATDFIMTSTSDSSTKDITIRADLGTEDTQTSPGLAAGNSWCMVGRAHDEGGTAGTVSGATSNNVFHIVEALTYDSVLSNTDQESVINWLATKYGITV